MAVSEWEVVEGDNIWNIAADTLATGDYQPTLQEIVVKMEELIKLNLDTLKASPGKGDAGLIYPGMRLRLTSVMSPGDAADKGKSGGEKTAPEKPEADSSGSGTGTRPEVDVPGTPVTKKWPISPGGASQPGGMRPERDVPGTPVPREPKKWPISPGGGGSPGGMRPERDVPGGPQPPPAVWPPYSGGGGSPGGMRPERDVPGGPQPPPAVWPPYSGGGGSPGGMRPERDVPGGPIRPNRWNYRPPRNAGPTNRGAASSRERNQTR